MQTSDNTHNSAETVRQCCTGASLEVLERMFFEAPDETPSFAPAPPEPCELACAVVTGTMRGVFRVAVEPPALRRLAAGFLGREDERTVTSAESRLVLCELTNMLCGNTLSRLHPDGRFRIGQPCAGDDARGDLDHPDALWLHVSLESGALAVRFDIDGAA